MYKDDRKRSVISSENDGNTRNRKRTSQKETVPDQDDILASSSSGENFFIDIKISLYYHLFFYLSFQ